MTSACLKATIIVWVLGSAACDEDGARSDAAQRECESAPDCINSEAAIAIGRCGLQDVWCEASGVCAASCRESCLTVASDFAACPDGLICNHSANNESRTYCTSLPISCASVDDCPLYLPNADAAWVCDEGICVFPNGF